MDEIDLSDVQIMDNQIGEIVTKVYNIIKSRSLQFNNISQITKITMEVVENYKEFTGEQKKKLVQECIKSLIDNYVVDNDQKRRLLKTAVDIVPELIETYIDISNGKLDINKGMKLGKKLTKCLCKC